MIPAQPQFTNDDAKFWGPIPSIAEWIIATLSKDAKVLECGPGRYPFLRADVFVDTDPAIPELNGRKVVHCDLEYERLPFADKAFDFVYTRHMLEDMYNPFHACAEMARVGKAGYIETPSPMAELCRGIDDQSPPFRGYHHHRYLVWEHDGALHFIPKFPLVEYTLLDDHGLLDLMRPSPIYWNSYFRWENGINTVYHSNPNPPHFAKDLSAAITQSRESAYKFWKTHNLPAEYSGELYVSKKGAA